MRSVLMYRQEAQAEEGTIKIVSGRRHREHEKGMLRAWQTSSKHKKKRKYSRNWEDFHLTAWFLDDPRYTSLHRIPLSETRAKLKSRAMLEVFMVSGGSRRRRNHLI